MAFNQAKRLLVGTVATVGRLHTVVPDQWVPITLIARDRGWSKGQTGRVALLAGATGSYLADALVSGGAYAVLALVLWLFRRKTPAL